MSSKKNNNSSGREGAESGEADNGANNTSSNNGTITKAEAQNATMSAERAFLTNLFESALAGNGPKVKQLVMEYVDQHNDVSPEDVLTQFKDGGKRTMLHFACKSLPNERKDGEEEDILSYLIGPKNSSWLSKSCIENMLRLKDQDGLTPLMMSAQISGGNCEQFNSKTNPVMAEKTRTVVYDRINLLLTQTPNGQKLSLARSKAGATPLHYASASGALPSTLKLLFECGKVALHTQSLQGGTPLHWACGNPPNVPPFDNSTVIATLIELGADVNASNEKGLPPLLLAVAAENDANATTLVKMSCQSVHASTDEGKRAKELDRGIIMAGGITVFHMAADLNLVGTLRALLEVDDYFSKDYCDSSTTKTIAQKCCELKNDNGYIPLDLAAQEGHVGCVMLLLPLGENSEEDAREFIAKKKAESSKKTVDKTINGIGGSTNATGNGDNETSAIKQSKNVEAEAESKAMEILSDAAINSVTQEDRDKAQSFKASGNKLFGTKEYAAAIQEYTSAIERDPTDATFYSNRSACYMALSDPTSTLSALSDAVITTKLKPSWPKAYYRLSVARLALGRHEDAAMAAWEGVKIDSENDELKSFFQKCVRLGKKAHKDELEKMKKEDGAGDSGNSGGGWKAGHVEDDNDGEGR